MHLLLVKKNVLLGVASVVLKKKKKLRQILFHSKESNHQRPHAEVTFKSEGKKTDQLKMLSQQLIKHFAVFEFLPLSGLFPFFLSRSQADQTADPGAAREPVEDVAKVSVL